MNRRNAIGIIGAAAAAMAAGGQAGAQASASATPATNTTAATPATRISRKIPSTGDLLPVIGLGTWQSFGVGGAAADRAPLELVLREFAELGGQVIDSSPMYGTSETVAGDLIAKNGLRSKLFIATKVWTSGKAAGIRQMEDSMSKLRAKPIDLMQVHNLLDVQTQLETLFDWKRKGLVRYVGVTHYTASGHDATARIMAAHPIDFVQINYSAAEREAEQRILPLALERGIGVIANRPFAGGDMFSRMRGKPLPAWAAEIDCTTWAQILLKFVVSHPALTCAIPATAKVTHLRDNMQAGYGRLPDEKMRAMIAAMVQ